MISILILIIEIITMSTIADKSTLDLFAPILIFIFSIGYLVDASKNKNGFARKALMAGYILRIALIFLDLYGGSIISLPNSGADSEWFYQMGLRYSIRSFSTSEYFIALTGYLIRIVGDSRLFIQFLVMLFSVVSLHMVVGCVAMMDIEDEIKGHAVLVMALLPNYAILSSIFLRESIVSMFISISLYFFIGWFMNRNNYGFYLSFLFVALAALFHSGSIGVGIGFLIVRILYDREKDEMRVAAHNIISTILVVVLASYILTRSGDVILRKLSDVSSIQDIANVRGSSGASYARYVGNSNNVGNFILYSPLRLVFFLFSPFPWQIRGISDIIAILFNSLFYLYTTVKAIQCLRRKYRDRISDKNRHMIVSLLIICGITAFIFAWGVSNTGTAIRHRDKMVAANILLLALVGGLPFRIKVK